MWAQVRSCGVNREDFVRSMCDANFACILEPEFEKNMFSELFAYGAGAASPSWSLGAIPHE